MLKKAGIKHEVLNAKNHEREAEIVAQAGKKGAVTIATNMAGRGTDIMLGGNAEYLAKADMRRQGVPDELINEATGFAETTNEEILAARKQYMELNEKYKQQIAPEAEEVRKAGGLFILGTERHESRRIDNQLRGRAGRQGDPGESCFFVSLEDDLMRLFGGDRVQAVMESLKIDEDVPIENSILTKTIESSQRKIEGRNYQIRKSVLDFDDVMSQQRMTIYSQRSKVLDGDDISESIRSMITDSIKENVDMFCQGDIADNWNITGLREHYAGVLTTPDDLVYTNDELNEVSKKDITEMLTERAEAIYAAKEAEYGAEVMRELERVVLLRNVDQKWMDHIDAMDELKRGIYLRSMGQKDPVVEYRFEGFAMFDEMIAAIREDTARAILTARLANNRQAPQRVQVMRPNMPQGTVRRAVPKPAKKDKKAAAKERAANAAAENKDAGEKTAPETTEE